MKKTILGLAFALSCGTSNAAFIGGNELYAACSSRNSVEQVYCLSYILGALDMGNDVLFCTPKGMTGQQALDLTMAFLRKSAPVRHYSANSLIAKTFGDMYPCQEKAPTATRRPV